MELKYHKAALDDLELLVDTRIQVLRAANQLPGDTDMREVRAQSFRYYQNALRDGTHIAYHTLDLLVKEIRRRGILSISLEATDMGRPLYEKYGFLPMEHEMELSSR